MTSGRVPGYVTEHVEDGLLPDEATTTIPEATAL